VRWLRALSEMASACGPSTQEVEAGRLQLQGWPGLQSETSLKKPLAGDVVQW
jgi:hypothetical protein